MCAIAIAACHTRFSQRHTRHNRHRDLFSLRPPQYPPLRR
jgi:hypothetical protein